MTVDGVTGANETHDPGLASWVESANAPGADFPIQNLPFGVRADPETGRGRVGVAIGDRILDVAAARAAGLLGAEADEAAAACGGETLNALMALGGRQWSALRRAVSRMLRADTAEGKAAQAADGILAARAGARMLLPSAIGDFTDFYASLHHATNVGRMLRPDNPLMPNYKHLPVAYHGRASSVVVSGAPCLRPAGQRKGPDDDAPAFGPTAALDFEAEMGVYVGPGNELGRPVPLDEAPDRVFGLSILNDWSARDVQAWEYQPLGPFLAKSFVSHVSPWVVTLEALAPFRCPALRRAEGDPRPLPYLSSAENDAQGGLDVALEVTLASRRMRDEGAAPARLARTNMRHLYWTIFQMLAHHASNGCNMRPGDLYGTGTISGPDADSLGSILEIARRGREPLRLPTGEERRFLADGDELVLRAWCEGGAARRIGFGECRAVVEGA